MNQNHQRLNFFCLSKEDDSYSSHPRARGGKTQREEFGMTQPGRPRARAAPTMESHSGASELGSGHSGRLQKKVTVTLFSFSLKCRTNFSDYCPLMILRKTHSSRGTVFPKARVIVAGERRLETPPQIYSRLPREVGRTLMFSSPTKNYPETGTRTQITTSASRRRVKARISKGRTCPKAGTRSRGGSWPGAWW